MVASIRSTLKRWNHAPFLFKLSYQEARARRPARSLRRVVSCRACGSMRILGTARGDYKTRDDSQFFCDGACKSLNESFVAQSDPVRVAKRQASRARARARSETKRQAVNKKLRAKICGWCMTNVTTRKCYCSDDCCRLAKNLKKRLAARQQNTL